MSKIVFGDWRDDNQQRRYPFADDATLIGDTLTIPKSLFIDGRLYPIGGNEDLFLSRVTRSGNVITFAVTATGAGELAPGRDAIGNRSVARSVQRIEQRDVRVPVGTDAVRHGSCRTAAGHRSAWILTAVG